MKNLKICDTHNDFLTELPLVAVKNYLEECKKNGVQKICASYWSSRREEKNIKTELLERKKILSAFDEVALLHIEDLWWVKSEDELSFLVDLHPFSCSLTWNGENCLAGGVGSEAGLSEWGRHCAETLLENGIVVDFAHLNQKSFWQMSDLVKQNIYCSHAGFCGVRPHERNLTDKQIDRIVSSGGFVGLFFFGKCVRATEGDARPFEVRDIVENLMYFKSHWGTDNIGIGTDFFGIETAPLGLEDYGGFENLQAQMQRCGFSPCEIEKIFAQNFQAFLKNVRFL